MIVYKNGKVIDYNVWTCCCASNGQVIVYRNGQVRVYRNGQVRFYRNEQVRFYRNGQVIVYFARTCVIVYKFVDLLMCQEWTGNLL